MYIPENTDFDKYDEPRLHMERLMRVRLTEFDFTLRILIILENANIKTLGDVCSLTKEQLLKVPQIGKLSADIIESELAKYDLRLRE